jgi:hypothetical protein
MGSLNLLGVRLGGNLIPPDASNQKGYFESLDVCLLNNELLNAMGASWDGVFPLPAGWWREARFDSFKPRMRELIERDFREVPLFGIKDPRMNRAFPLWKEVLDGLGIRPVCAFSLRSPLEVARSLHRRDGFPTEYSLLTWMTNMVEAEAATRGYPRAFIEYRELLKDPSGTLRGLEQALHLAFPRKVEEGMDELSGFLDDGIVHHLVPDPAQAPEGVAGLVMEFYSLCRDSGLDGAAAGEAAARMDEIAGEFQEASRLFLNPEVARRLGERESLRFELAATDERLRATENLLADSRKQVESARTDIQGLSASLAEAGRSFAELEARANWLEGELAARAAALAAREAQLAARDEELAAIKRTFLWRLMHGSCRPGGCGSAK